MPGSGGGCYHDNMAHNRVEAGELRGYRALLAAVLLEAVRDFAAGRQAPWGVKLQRHKAARLWFEGAPAPVTFEGVCDALDLSPSRTWQAVQRVRAGAVSKLRLGGRR